MNIKKEATAILKRDILKDLKKGYTTFHKIKAGVKPKLSPRLVEIIYQTVEKV